MSLVLANATVIHGDPAVAPRRADVLVQDERIADVGSPGAFDALEDARRMNLAGRTLLPGLIDLHVHLCLTGAVNSSELFREEPVERQVARAVGHAQRHLAAGVTTVRDLGGLDAVVFAVRDAIADGLVAGPRVLASGRVVTTTNGHGSWMGAIADTAEEVAAAVTARADAGADCVKIVATGGVHTPGSDLMAAQYTEAELRAGAEAAHRRGLVVGSHASNPTGISNAVRAGIDTIEHGVFLDDASAALMAEHGTTFVPTLAATVLFGPRANDPAIPDYVRDKAALTVPAHSANFPFAIRHGVTIATGTDAGSTFVEHGMVAVEVEILTRFGMSPLEAIAAGTRNAARVLHIDGQVGTVEPGRMADLVVVDGDPVADITALRRVALVLRAGGIARENLATREPGATGQ